MRLISKAISLSERNSLKITPETHSLNRFIAIMSALILSMAPFLSADAGYTRMYLAKSDMPAPSGPLKLYGVKTVNGKRKGPSGEERDYTIYMPEAPEGMPKGPYPMVVLIHGFLMTGFQQSANALNLAERGFVVFTPNLTKVLLGDKTRMDNVHDIISDIKWLSGPDSPYPGLVDPDKVAVGGNSSGGAVILEVGLEMQKMHVPVAALVSLDGVMWDRSHDRIPELSPVKLLSLRCEPSLCNEHARLLERLEKLKFPIDDVKVIGSHHCDVENPTTMRCSCVCGTTHDKYRQIFAQLLYSWLRDTFNATRFSNNTPTFVQLAETLSKEHKIAAHINDPVSSWLTTKDARNFRPNHKTESPAVSVSSTTAGKAAN